MKAHVTHSRKASVVIVGVALALAGGAWDSASERTPVAWARGAAALQSPTSIVVDHPSGALFESIPGAYLDAAAALIIPFMDRSVGGNIDSGLDCLAFPSDEVAHGGCTVLNHDDPIYDVGPSEPLGPGDLVPSLSFVPVVNGLSQPVFVTHAGDGSGRLFVLEREGLIRVINASGSLLPTPFLDITSLVRSSGNEEGLLGLAFHPAYPSNDRFFVAYTDTAGDLALARYSVSADPNVADPGSAAGVLTVPHPTNSNHNGGMLAFDGSGYLYWSTGDGGGAGDPANNAQNLDSLLGKILRLDIDSASPYAIPADNPFVGVTGARAEIWDYGLRNPWRYSLDRDNGDLYIGDVGQGSREEIDFEPAGSGGGFNYGWRVMEGSLCFSPPSGCDMSGKVLPVAEYANDSSTCAVTGGYVYRGVQHPPMTGIYFFGDYCGGQIWGLLQQGPGVWDVDLIEDTSFFISSFGEDEAGELYLTDYAGGSVQRILGPGIPTPSPTPSPSASATATSSATPTPSATPLRTATAKLPPTATATSLPTETATSLPTATATLSPSSTATAVPSSTPTATPLPVDTATPSASAPPADTDTPAPSATPSDTAPPPETGTPSATPADTATAVPSSTPSPTALPVETPTPSFTPPPTATTAPSATPTVAAAPGDLNVDGTIDIVDLQLCVNVVLGSEVSPDIVARADLNSDLTVDILDVQMLVNIILGGS